VGNAAADAGNAGAIRALDPVPHDEVPWWMAAADVVCVPSWHEGMPNVRREVHACGRPVVATRAGGIPEAMGAGGLGILVSPKDPEALAAALARQLERPPADPETIRRLAQLPQFERRDTGTRNGACSADQVH
jgi:glycosyltransferase involved in cell wall biosynthesis